MLVVEALSVLYHLTHKLCDISQRLPKFLLLDDPLVYLLKLNPLS